MPGWGSNLYVPPETQATTGRLLIHCTTAGAPRRYFLDNSRLWVKQIIFRNVDATRLISERPYKNKEVLLSEQEGISPACCLEIWIATLLRSPACWSTPSDSLNSLGLRKSIHRYPHSVGSVFLENPDWQSSAPGGHGSSVWPGLPCCCSSLVTEDWGLAHRFPLPPSSERFQHSWGR